MVGSSCELVFFALISASVSATVTPSSSLLLRFMLDSEPVIKNLIEL